MTTQEFKVACGCGHVFRTQVSGGEAAKTAAFDHMRRVGCSRCGDKFHLTIVTAPSEPEGDAQ